MAEEGSEMGSPKSETWQSRDGPGSPTSMGSLSRPSSPASLGGGSQRASPTYEIKKRTSIIVQEYDKKSSRPSLRTHCSDSRADIAGLLKDERSRTSRFERGWSDPNERRRRGLLISEDVVAAVVLESNDPFKGCGKSSVRGGVLVEFIQRINEKEVPACKELMTTSDPSEKRTVAEALMRPHRYPGWGGYGSALCTVENELLLAALRDDVTMFWKVNKNPSWQLTPNLWTSRACEMGKMFSVAKCLRHEVTQWLFQHKILHCHPPDSETVQERYDRTQALWSDYHNGSRKEEVPAISYPFKDNLRRRIYGDEDAETNPKSAKNLNRCLRSSSPLSPEKQRPGSAPCARLRPGSAPCARSASPRAIDFDWKRRSTRSRVSAGAWDWANDSTISSRPASASGVQPRAISSRPSSASRVQPSRHWSTALLDVDSEELQEFSNATQDQQEMIEEGKETFLSQSARYKEANGSTISSRPSSASRVQLGLDVTLLKSSSLPTLLRVPSNRGLRDKVLGVDQRHASKKSLRHGLADPRARPPTPNAHVDPWHKKCLQPVLKCEDSAAKQYLRACRQGKTIPRTFSCITGHSLKMKAGGQMLYDRDLLSIAVVLDELCLQEIDLESNTALTEKSFLKFFSALSKGAASTSLASLSLKGCHQASKPSVLTTIISLIDEGVQQLRLLDLTGVVMGTKSQLPFARAVRGHGSLTSLTLCNTGIGSIQIPEVQKDFVCCLLGNKNIVKMDLGWNCFSSDFFSYLGERHAQMQTLHRLSLSNCSSSPQQSFATNIVYFLEYLSHDKTLRFLDISLNYVDFRGALVVEDALMNCNKLTELKVSQNPLGAIGMRSLLRLLCTDSSGLIEFDCRDCFCGPARGGGEGLQMYSAASPGGRYNLELERPYHRSLLRMLYKTCEHFNMNPADAFSHVVYSLPPFVHAHKDEHGVWIVPQRGTLSTTFSVDAAVLDKMRGIDDYDFDGILKRELKLMRCSPSFRKIVPLFAQWFNARSRVQEQLVMLDALSKDFLLTYAHIRQLSFRCSSVVGEITERLLASVDEVPGSLYLTLALNKGLMNYAKTLRRVERFMMFNPQNPNGHYVLQLANHVEYGLAERLLLLDRWESGVVRKRGLVDISQRGNYSVIRNERYQNQTIEAAAMAEWLLPEYDTLEFDYSSTRRAPAKYPLDEITHSNIILTLQESGCRPDDQVSALRMLSHQIFLTSKQLRGLFGIYKDEALFAELLVTFLVQVVDMQNEKIFRVKIQSQSMLADLGKRLGFIIMFPYIQPEQSIFVLDLAERDQRIAVNTLMNLAKSEDPYNLRSPEYILPNGEKDPLTSGIPRSWEALEKVPKGGVLTVTYVCAAEKRNFHKRKQLYETFGYQSLTVEADDVMWWSSLNTTPADVIEFLEFLICRFDTMRDAFVAINSGEATGTISLREFEDSNRKLGCKKFKGDNEMRRIETVFRFMDVSGEGTVSLDEFMVLDQMFKEILYCVEEFVNFCVRTFGLDPGDTWLFIDDDESGEIDEIEWVDACAKIGYLGSAMPIFKYLDKDDEGTISLDEFMALEKLFDARRR